MIAETKKALSNAGVNIKALEEFASKKAENSKRSNHVILVKNLPYTSNEGDLAGMFGKYGSLDKVVLPPTRVLALVCQSLFNHHILYLYLFMISFFLLSSILFLKMDFDRMELAWRFHLKYCLHSHLISQLFALKLIDIIVLHSR